MNGRLGNAALGALIGAFAALAYGALAVLAVLFFLHVGRLLTGATLSPRVVAPLVVLASLGGAVAGITMTIAKFRRKSLPPWIAPRRLSRDAQEAPVRAALMARLVPLEPGETVYRDRETGQLWAEVYWHDGYQEGYDIVPIARVDAPAHTPIKGGKPPPWVQPRSVSWKGPAGDEQARLLARLDKVTDALVAATDTAAGIYRDRYTGQIWRSIYAPHGFGSGYDLDPVLADDGSTPPREPKT